MGEQKLLKFVRGISFPAIDEFVVAEKFRAGETVDGVKIVWIGGNFKTNFLKKVEKLVPALEMREHELVDWSRDPSIITELGGEKRVESFLAHLWECLKANPKLRRTCYIYNENGALLAVCSSWSAGGLSVRAHPLNGPVVCDPGPLFLSR